MYREKEFKMNLFSAIILLLCIVTFTILVIIPNAVADHFSGIAPTDIFPPDTIIIASPSDPSNSSSALFGFNSTELGKFECKLDEKFFSPCTSPKSFSNLQDGKHDFYVRAIDNFGNVDLSAAEFHWLVSTAGTDNTNLFVSGDLQFNNYFAGPDR